MNNQPKHGESGRDGLGTRRPPPRRPARGDPAGIRPVFWLVLVLAAAALALVAGRWWAAPDATDGNQQAKDSGPGSDAGQYASAARGQTSESSAEPAPSQPASWAAPESPPLPSSNGQSRVSAGQQAAGPSVSLSPQQAAEWKERLRQLVQRGDVPAIAAFLRQNVDYQFGSESVASPGFSSARAAMLDALNQIGGTDALAVMAQTLRSTASPQEIAILAQDLQGQAPGTYVANILSAARETLAMASNGQLDKATDVGPLFEVLAKYGGTEAVADLQQASGQWKYYAAIALAQLPDGAGIPALIQATVAPPPKASDMTEAALQTLAQVSVQYPEAGAALLQQARDNKIPSPMWPYLTSGLMGDQFLIDDGSANPANGLAVMTIHISSGNQNYYSVPTANNFTPGQITARLTLIDNLMASVSDPGALENLQQSRTLMADQYSQKTTAPSPSQ